MCKIKEVLLPHETYCGIIIREEYGHRFFPVNVKMASGGRLVPVKTTQGEMWKSLEKTTFALRQAKAVIVAEFCGDKVQLRSLILGLNEDAGLPGVAYEPAAA